MRSPFLSQAVDDPRSAAQGDFLNGRTPGHNCNTRLRSLFEGLQNLNRAVPNHLAGESPKDRYSWCIRLSRLNFDCEVIRYRLVQVR